MGKFTLYYSIVHLWNPQLLVAPPGHVVLAYLHILLPTSLLSPSQITVGLSQGFCSYTKYHDQEASWGRKGLFSLHIHITVHHQRSQERNSHSTGTWRQELMQRPWRCVAYWTAPLAYLVCFLTELRTTSPGMVPPTMGWAPPSLITNWENVLHLNFMEAFPQGRLLSLW